MFSCPDLTIITIVHHSSVDMPWTGEDTKDVFKKVIGGLIAAAVLGIAYTLMERAEWYYAAALTALLVLLLLLLLTILSRQAASRVEPSAIDTEESSLPVRKTDVGETRAPSPAVSTHSDGPAGPDYVVADGKALKKEIKAEQKRRKKEAKAGEKED
jgi:predicted lipid-binding transport protein (Tim44 family)